MRRLAFLLLLLPLAPEAQTGTCPGEAVGEGILEGNGVRARLFTDGGLFADPYRSESSNEAYEVPVGSGSSAFYSLDLWVLGLVDGDLRSAATAYGPHEYRPGPLDASGAPPADCSAYDRVWVVSLEDIARYNATGEPTDDLAEWPADLGAPVVDGDGIAGNYDLASGDRPAILGSASAWWVMNDRAVEHRFSQTPPVGLEVGVMAYAVSDAYAEAWLGTPPEVAQHLHHATAYRYRITYHGDAPLTDAFFGLWADAQVGYFGDDYAGVDAARGTAYLYNGSDFDGGDTGYGVSPPAVGVTVLGGPVAERLHASGAMFNSGSIYGLPSSGQQAYDYSRGLWRKGEPFTYGGTGVGGTTPTRYRFSDRPPGYWSEMNLDGAGSANSPFARRFFLSHGPFTLLPGETATFTFAIPWARSDAGALASLDRLLVEAVPAMEWLPETPDPRLASVTPSQLPVPLPEPPETPEAPERYAAARTVWPNPASGETTLRLDLPDAATVRLTVTDALGRTIATPQDGPLAGAEHRLPIQTEGWAPGVYVYRLTVSPEAGGAPIETGGRFVVIR